MKTLLIVLYTLAEIAALVCVWINYHSGEYVKACFWVLWFTVLFTVEMKACE